MTTEESPLIQTPVLCSYTETVISTTFLSNDLSPHSEWNTPEGCDSFMLVGDNDMPCPYCRSTLHLHKIVEKMGHSRKPSLPDSLRLWQCESCGWWVVRSYAEREDPMQHSFQAEVYHAVARQYRVDNLELPISLLREYLRSHPSHIAYTNPRSFELLMRDCIRDAYAPCEVLHTGSTGDGGVDLKLVTAENETFLVQVKRREDLGGSEGVNTIRQLNGVLFRENAAKGMIVTSAKRFTRGSVQEVCKTQQQHESYEMRLLAFDDVVGMLRLKPAHPYAPWQKLIARLKAFHD